jgi:hypothetical protein
VAGGGGNEHEVLAGTGTQPQPGSATGQPVGGGSATAGRPLSLSKEQQKQLAEAEKRAAKAARKAEKEVCTSGCFDALVKLGKPSLSSDLQCVVSCRVLVITQCAGEEGCEGSQERGEEECQAG